VERGSKGSVIYDTIPLGIIITKDYLVTVCLEDHPIFAQLLSEPVLYTFKKTRFLLLVLIKTANLYLN